MSNSKFLEQDSDEKESVIRVSTDDKEQRLAISIDSYTSLRYLPKVIERIKKQQLEKNEAVDYKKISSEDE